MVKAKNLPNLGKQTQKVIGKMVRENKQVQKRAISKDYNPRKDTTLYSMKYDMKKREELYITKSVHNAFVRLLENIEIVFNAENIEYDIDQVATKLEDFIENIVSTNEPYDLKMINNFIEKIKKTDYVIYFFRLFDFEYQEKTNLGPNIMIISGQELLKDIPNVKDLNRKAEENPKYETLIQPDDILLGVSVIDTGKITGVITMHLMLLTI